MKKDLFERPALVTVSRLASAPISSGRPVEFDELTFVEVLARVANGATLKQLSVDPLMPLRRTVQRWLDEDLARRPRYLAARRLRADALADETLELSDSNKAILAPQAVKLQVDARRWLAGKHDPATYGDRVEVDQTITHTADVPLLEVARRLAFLLDAGVRELPDIVDNETIVEQLDKPVA